MPNDLPFAPIMTQVKSELINSEADFQSTTLDMTRQSNGTPEHFSQ